MDPPYGKNIHKVVMLNLIVIARPHFAVMDPPYGEGFNGQNGVQTPK